VDSSVFLRSALERRKKERKYYRRNKIDFSSFHHLSFLFPFLHFRAKMRLFFFITTPITHCTKHDSLLERHQNFTFHIAFQSVKLVAFFFFFLFVQDPSILWSATLNVTAMPNVWRRTNPLLPPVVTLYSKLLNAGQVFLSLIVIVFVPFVIDEFGFLEEEIYTWKISFISCICWEQKSVESPC